MHVDNNIQLFDGFEDNFLEWQYCPCDRFSVIGTSTDYMYLFTINIWYKELVNLVYFENKFRIVSSISIAAAACALRSRAISYNRYHKHKYYVCFRRCDFARRLMR